jgi:hypothetical protein
MVLMISVAIGQVRAQSTSLQDSTGLPGDSFSLQGALEMFKKAASPEDFERLINTRDNSVNNLDVNGDGDVDYVRVIDRVDNSAHAFVLQVPVSESESQDIAVIEVEKTGDASAMVQIVGDEDIYGEQTIVEPDGGGGDTEDVEDDGNGKGPSHRERVNESSTESRVVINVWTWPCVRFVYAPTYTVWVSPWRWRAYPAWWHPWRPLAWRVFHPFRLRYHAGFAVVRTHRMVHAHRIYAPVRTTSVTVRARHQGSVKHYRVTRTTTVKTRPGGTKVKTRTTTTKVRKNRR